VHLDAREQGKSAGHCSGGQTEEWCLEGEKNVDRVVSEPGEEKNDPGNDKPN